MSTDGIHTAAGAPGVLVLDDEQYLLAPLELGDMPNILNWLEVRPQHAARRKLDALGDQATDAYRDKLFAKAEEEAEAVRNHPDGALQVFKKEPNRITGEVAEGFVYAVYVMLRKNHPDITWEETCALVSIENVDAIAEVFDRVHALAEKTTARRQRARRPRKRK